jgi:hypothetical protein
MRIYRLFELSKADQKAIMAAKQAGIPYFRIREDLKGRPTLFGSDVAKSARMTHYRQGMNKYDMMLVPIEAYAEEK